MNKRIDNNNMPEAIETITVSGIRFHCIDVTELRRLILQATETPSPSVIANVNVHAVNLAHKHHWFRDFLNRADVVFCDGFGVLLGAWLLGWKVKLSYRMTAPDYLDGVAAMLEAAGKSLFLLGGEPGVAENAAAMLQAKFPRLAIEYHHGYFAKHGVENAAVVEAVNRAAPDLLMVGFGMPLQERWIADNLPALNVRAVMPLGAFLDHYTGRSYRGPRWLNAHGFEWLARLVSEPRRLCKRYAVGNPLFFARVLAERWQRRRDVRSSSAKDANHR